MRPFSWLEEGAALPALGDCHPFFPQQPKPFALHHLHFQTSEAIAMTTTEYSIRALWFLSQLVYFIRGLVLCGRGAVSLGLG